MYYYGLEHISTDGNNSFYRLIDADSHEIGLEDYLYYSIKYYPSGNDIVISCKEDTEYSSGTVFKYIIKDAALTDENIYLGQIDYEGVLSNLVEIRYKDYDPTQKKNVYTGSNLNESIKSTKANETFILGGGNDKITFEIGIDYGWSFGKDTVKISEGENLSLILNGIRYSDIGSMYKDGDDLVIHCQRAGNEETPTQYGDIRIQDFQKLGLGSISLHLADGDEMSGDKTYNELANEHLLHEMTKLYDVTGKNKKFKGSNFNEKTTSTKANEVFSLGAGNDIVYFKNLFGKDNINLKSEEVLTLDFTQMKNPEYIVSRSGNKAIVKVQTEDDGKNIIDYGQITLTNYFKLANRDTVIISDENNTGQKLSDMFQNELKYDYSKANKKQTINATFLDEEITGSKYADKINTYEGNDTVTAGKGNDTIVLGKGSKTIKISGGDGNDVIKGLSNADSLAIVFDDLVGEKKYIKSGYNLIIEHSIYSYKKGKTTIYTTDDIHEIENKKAKGTFYYNDNEEKVITKAAYNKLNASEKENYTLVEEDVYYYKKGKTTVYTLDDIREAANTLVTEKTTIYDYFKDDNASKVNGIDIDKLYVQGYDNIRWAEDGGYVYPLFGTDHDDIITGSSKMDIIMTGNGNDIITPGKGNDYIAVANGTYTKDGWSFGENSTGEKTINFNKGDGKDSVAYDPINIGLLNMNFDENGTISYYKQGDALVIQNYFGKTAKSKAVKDTVSLPGFFMFLNSTNNLEYYGGIENVLQKTQINGNPLNFESGLVVNPEYDEYTKTYTYTGTYFTNDIMTYSGKGYAKMSGDDGNDTYNIGKLTANTNVFISDVLQENQENNDNNLLKINSKASDLAFIFDVDSSGNFVIENKNETEYIWGLQIYRKSDLITGKNISKNFRNKKFGSVTIDEYFSEKDDSVVAANNMAIYLAKDDNGTLVEFNVNTYIAGIAEAVGSWLTANHYSTSYEAYMDTTTDVTSLLKVYATGEYNGIS